MRLYLLLCLLIFLWKEVSPGSTRVLFDRTQLPRLSDTDMIELYHLRSFPLLLIDTVAGSFSTQTTGLALRSTTSGETIVLQYKPVNYSNCFLPIIGEGEGNNATLIWDKRAEVVYYNAIDTEFWQQSTFLARINGIVYKNYIRWIESYVATNRQFSPQSICSSVNDLSCFTFAETWETFLADSYQAFASFSVRLNAILPPRAVELRFLSFHEPVEFQLSSSATPNPSEQPSSSPSVSPSASPTVAVTATPTAFNDTLADVIAIDFNPSHQPVPENGDGRHFSDDEADVSSSSETTEDSRGRDRRGRKAVRALTHSSSSNRNRERRRSRNLRRMPSRSAGGAAAPLESVEDSELDRPPRGGGLFPPSDDPLAPTKGGGGGAAGGGEGSVEEVSVSEVAEYYSNIMSCMEEYQLGDFTNALKSCMSETVGFVHIDGDRYYRIKHRYPFIYVYDYLEYIPDPQYSAVHGADYADMGIIFFIGIIAFIGFVASMAKLQVAEFFCADGYWWTFNSNSDIEKTSSEDCDPSSPHAEVGYTQQQSRTSRVMTKVYSSLGWKSRNFSSQYSSVPTSDDDLAALGYRERVQMHSFGKETLLSSQDEEHEQQRRARGISNASSASSSGYIGVPRMGSVSFDASSPRATQVTVADALATTREIETRNDTVSLEMKEFK